MGGISVPDLDRFIPIVTLYVALLSLMLLYLTIRVIMVRQKIGVEFGTGDNEDLIRAQRVQGNFIELVPMCLILIAVTEWRGAPDWIIHGLGGVLVIARVLHAQGLFSSAGRSFGRLAGTLGTFLVLLVGGLMGLYQAVMSLT